MPDFYEQLSAAVYDARTKVLSTDDLFAEVYDLAISRAYHAVEVHKTQPDSAYHRLVIASIREQLADEAALRVGRASYEVADVVAKYRALGVEPTVENFPYANHHGYSDVNPYQVVRIVSPRCLEVRPMKCERSREWAPDFRPGGFCGTVVNQSEQRWVITQDESAPVSRIRLGKRGWRSPSGERYVLSTTPHKFYDYNF